MNNNPFFFHVGEKVTVVADLYHYPAAPRVHPAEIVGFSATRTRVSVRVGKGEFATNVVVTMDDLFKTTCCECGEEVIDLDGEPYGYVWPLGDDAKANGWGLAHLKCKSIYNSEVPT